ncbi:MAG: outer membrane protein assembly factor BamA [Nitrospinae bacterium]|nr:outer membrane protein assembly factor BamA [Nitrospinota bacterium]
MKNFSACFLAAVLALSLPRAAAAVDLEKPVKEIIVAGAKRANENTIRFYIRSKTGEPYSVQTTREDIRRIYNLGYFDDIRLATRERDDGLALIYEVKEKPFVKSVTIKGAKEVPDKDMQVLIAMKKGSFFQKHLLKKDILKIKNKYIKKGFYFTEVKTSVTDAGNNQVDVAYDVIERQKVKIGRMVFRGNRFLSDYQLAEIIESRAAGFWQTFSDAGNYQREILKVDVLRIESRYRDFGFIKARLDEPKVEVDREDGVIVITLTVHEGDQYFLGDIAALGDDIHTADEIMARMSLKKGEPFNQSLFRQNLFSVQELYMDDGYAYATPLPDIVEHPETKTVDITVKIDPGRVVYIGRIGAVGNYKSNDNVIRRELRLKEGERFSGKKLNRSRQRIANTGFFSGADVEQKSGREPDTMDLNLNLTERETGSMKAGMGYSSLENLMLNASVTENNLLGTGRRLSLGVESSKLRQDYYIDFTEPRWQDRDVSLGFSLFARQFDYISYTSNSTGAGLTLGKGFGEYTQMSLGYRFEAIKVTINQGLTPTPFLRSQEGIRDTSSLSFTVTHDERDLSWHPTAGFKVSGDARVAGGPLGGDVNYYKLSLDGAQYWKLPHDFVVMAHGAIKYAGSYGGKTLPLFEHYFMGGPYDLRGFTFADVGPRDTNGQSIGGDASLVFNLETAYAFTKTFEGVVFYDRGQIYGEEGDLSKTTDRRYDLENMRHSVGWGLRIITPAMPIWLAWGFKLDTKPDESPMEFHFTMGRTF